MIDALVAGKIYGTPLERVAKNGNPYVTARMRAPTRDGEAQFINIVAFSNSAVAALLALEDGDAAALAGELTAKAYTSKDGEPKPSLDLLAHHVLTEFHVTRKRQAISTARKEQPATAAPEDSPSKSSGSADELDDDIPF